MDNEKIKEELTKSRLEEPYTKEDLLSTSSTLLNLSLTGRVEGGFVKGRYFFFVGDSVSGKTFICLSALAEACKNKNFEDYRLVHDDVEGGALMNMKKFFGEKVVKRLEVFHSETVEDFYCNLDDAFDYDQPFIWILDSQDALGSKYSERKFQELKRSHRKGTEAKGDFGDGKAKMHSGRLRGVCSNLMKSKSILIIISQTRDNLDGGMFSPKAVYSGGRSLKFYSCAQIWTSTRTRLKKRIRGKDRQIGMTAKVDVKKNRLTGKEWSVEVPLYFSYGVDDIGSCVDFLVAEDHWKKRSNGRIVTDLENIQGFRDDIIKKIEESNLEDQVRTSVGEVWKSIEADCAVERKKRYE